MTTSYPKLLADNSIRYRWVIAGAISFASTSIFLYKAVAVSAWPSQAVVWGGIALATYATGFLCLVGAQRTDGLGLAKWQFGPWILIWFALTYGLATVTWRQPQTGTTVASIALSSVMRALWLVAAGLTAWFLGYLIGPGSVVRAAVANRVTAVTRQFAGEVRSPFSPWILYAIGTAARLASAATTGRFGYIGNTASSVTTATGYGQILNILEYCAPFAVAAAALQVFRERISSARVTLAVLLSAELAVSAISGDKVNFLVTALEITIPYSAARRRLPKATMISTVIFFVLVVTPFTAAYRTAVRDGSTFLTSSQAAQKAPSLLKSTLNAGLLAANIPDSTNYLLERIQEIDSAAIIIQRTPQQINYANPMQLIQIPLTGFVPRAVWHGKPVQLPMYEVSQEYYDQPATVYTAAAITPVGDLYRYGGWIPVILGMSLLGCVTRLLDDVLDIFENPQVIFLLLLLYPSVVVAESGWVAIFSGIPLTIIVWVFAVAIAFRQPSVS
jgi:hypothetical protein